MGANSLYKPFLHNSIERIMGFYRNTIGYKILEKKLEHKTEENEMLRQRIISLSENLKTTYEALDATRSLWEQERRDNTEYDLIIKELEEKISKSNKEIRRLRGIPGLVNRKVGNLIRKIDEALEKYE